MQKYSDLVLNARNGTPLRAASVTVKTYPGGALATIYSDNGVTPAANPLTSDANGRYAFYAADGRYTLEIAASGFDMQTISDVQLEDPSDSDPTPIGGLLDLSGASAGQIKFPATQNASADANTLDDYEEGTWTPAITFNGGSTGVTYFARSGNYTKIGRLVYASFKFTLTSKGSSSGLAAIAGLPFTVAESATYYAMGGEVTEFQALATSIIRLPLIAVPGTATIEVRITVAAATGNNSIAANTDFNNNSTLQGWVLYHATP
jgi:hypothetical protein